MMQTAQPQIGACPYMDAEHCPDIRKVQAMDTHNPRYESLAEQRYELCERGGISCSLRERLDAKSGGNR